MSTPDPATRYTLGERPLVLLEAPNGEYALGERLRDSIVTCWTATLRERFDWGERPLVSYGFGAGFLSALDACDLDEVALLSAMVASGQVDDLDGCWVERRIDEGHLVPLGRDDRAQGWRCTHRVAASRACLDYWVLPSGSIEFESFRHHHPVMALLVGEVPARATT